MRIYILFIFLLFNAARVSGQHFLSPGMELNRGYPLYSHDYKYKLILNPSGKLEIIRVKDQHTIWTSPNAPHENMRCIMDKTGNLILFSNNKIIWTSGLAKNIGAYLLMRIDGNLVIYSSEHKNVWASKSNEY
jgi:hypothetical protein